MTIVNGYKAENIKKDSVTGYEYGLKYSHRIIAEKKLGRKLKPEEVVHHIDEDKSNNDPDNLIVFATKADHTSYHNGGTIYFDDEGIAHTHRKQENKYCIICGKKLSELSRASTKYCEDCFHLISRKVKRPDRETLKNLIRTTPFTTIGAQYKVSDNAIRKWCKSYNLPYRVKDIKAYTDEEWKNV